MDLITTGHLSTDDQEYKLEEGVIEESSSRRIYQRRRRNHSRRDETKEEAKEESKEESKYESKEDDSSAGVEESKDRDTPRHDVKGDGSLLSPSLRSSRPIHYSPQLSAAAASIDKHDTKPSPMISSSSIRRRPEDKLKKRFSHRLRRAADDIPEVHFIGEICEGVGFKGTYVSCKWYIEWGKSWSLLEGEDSSQTQYTASNVWNHPIDVHFASTSMLEWPRIIVQVWTLDSYGRSILAGYGFTHLPTNPGEHELEINCWKPTNGSIREKLEEFFLGRTPSCLLDEAVIFGKAWENRSQLTTVSSGKVKLNVNVVLRFFDQHNVK